MPQAGESAHRAPDGANPASLMTLSRSSDPETRSTAARDPSCPSELLTRLAADADTDVRSGAASNPNTPTETLRRLATDPERGVRYRAASNPNSPSEILTRVFAITVPEGWYN